MEVLYLIIALIALVLIFKLIKFLFTNFIISRIISVVLCIVSFILAFSIESNVDDAYNLVMVDLFTTIFSWLFYIGPVVFDVEWDGTYNVVETYDGYEIQPNMVGGFIGNFIGAAIIAAIAYLLIGPEFTLVFYGIPAIILIMNVSMIIKVFR